MIWDPQRWDFPGEVEGQRRASGGDWLGSQGEFSWGHWLVNRTRKFDSFSDKLTFNCLSSHSRKKFLPKVSYLCLCSDRSFWERLG